MPRRKRRLRTFLGFSNVRMNLRAIQAKIAVSASTPIMIALRSRTSAVPTNVAMAFIIFYFAQARPSEYFPASISDRTFHCDRSMTAT